MPKTPVDHRSIYYDVVIGLIGEWIEKIKNASTARKQDTLPETAGIGKHQLGCSDLIIDEDQEVIQAEGQEAMIEIEDITQEEDPEAEGQGLIQREEEGTLQTEEGDLDQEVLDQ